jgi:hypothetical protein
MILIASLTGATTAYFNIHYQNINSVHYIRDLCINRNNHQKPTFHPLGDFLNPALALLGQGLKKFKSVSAGKTFIAFCLKFFI